MDQIIGFGKHKGKTFKAALSEDPKYCKWLLNQQILINEDARQALSEALKGKDLDDLIHFGKYKNRRTIAWIHANDRPYFDWLCTNTYVNCNCPELAKKIDDLIAKHG
jgi:hypothetical protein